MKKLILAILDTPKFTIMSWRYVGNPKEFFEGYIKAWRSFYGYN